MPSTYSLDCGDCKLYQRISPSDVKITASSDHTVSVMSQLKRLQNITSAENLSVFYPEFKDYGVKSLSVSSLLPTIDKILNAEKFCHVTHSEVTNEPILAMTYSEPPVSGRVFVVDGHTRAAIKLATQGPDARARVRLLSCSLAKTYQKMYDDEKSAKSIAKLLDYVYAEGVCPRLKKS